jgi:predicted ATP-grasp superfamily ATP-dependent carboligase
LNAPLRAIQPLLEIGEAGNEVMTSVTHPVAVFNNNWSATLSFTVSLGRQGVPLHFYGPGAGGWSRYCTKRSVCPPVTDTDAFLPWLRSRIRSGEIIRVAPTTDLIAYYVSVLRDEFAPEIKRTIPLVSELETCLIKTRFATACERIGQPVPATFAPESLEEAVAAAQQLGFPLVMKPNSHLLVALERGRIVYDMDELREYYRPYTLAPGQTFLAERYPYLRWPILQRYIPSARSRVYSVSGFKDPHTGVVAASVSCKRAQWPPDVGVSTSQISCASEPIMSTGLEAVEQLLSSGIFELELLVDGEGLLAIDLNPRAFGFMALDMALGNDLPWLWYQSTQHQVIPLERPAVRPVMEARLVVPHAVSRIVGTLFGLRPETPSGREEPHASISMLGHWADPVPMLMSNLSSLRHPGGLIRPYIAAARVARRDARRKTQGARLFGGNG